MRRVEINFKMEPQVLEKEVSDWWVNLLEGSVWLKNCRRSETRLSEQERYKSKKRIFQY